jgi:hypothetical protein
MPETLGPFGGAGIDIPVVIPPTPPPPPPSVSYAAYGDQTNAAVYYQGVTEKTSGPFGVITGPLSPLYFATQATAYAIATLLGGTVSLIDVGASQPQYVINIAEQVKNAGGAVTGVVVRQYNAGLLANGLYHGDVTPANASSLG